MITATPESAWLSERAPLWDELNGLLAEAAANPRKMSRERVDLLALRYQQAAADLAYMRTHQPTSTLLPRLNDLVARGHAIVYRKPRGSWRGLMRFQWVTYPRLVWEIRRFVLLAAAIGLTITVIGFVWAVHDPVSASSFLPASVRDAGYFKHEPIPAGLMAPTAAGIFMNNIIVSFYVFAGGITFGLWTLYAIYQNSMLLGVLSGLTNRDGFNSEYWSLIVPHGVIELTSLAICAGAGLTLADALIRARDEPRRVVLRRNAQRGALVVAGTMPLLVIAGCIEGFVTPSGLPVAAKLAIAPLTGVLLAAYLLRGRRAPEAAH
jgi:uncharacterized membrane protein SpoIIM required for sporulation